MILSKHAKFYKLTNDQYVVYNNLIFEPVILDMEEYNKLKNSKFELLSKTDLDILIDKCIIGDVEKDKIAEDMVVNYFNQDRGISLAYIIPTNICNLQCKYCFIGELNDNKVEYITEETIRNTITKLYNENRNYDIKTTTIIFYGAEPLLALKQIKYACEYCKKNYKNFFDFAIVTNGTLMTEEVIQLFKQYKFTVGISIDGPKLVNDKNRVFKNSNESVYDKACATLALLKKHEIDFGLSMTLTKDVLQDKDFFTWIKSLGIKDISYNLLHFNEKDKDYEKYYKEASKFLFKSNKILGKEDIVDDRLQRKIRAFHSKEIKLNDCAAVGGGQICVAPNGNVTVCHGYWHKNQDLCGNINQNSLTEIKNCNNFKKWKKRMTANHEKCLNCPGLWICGGGCYLQSENIYDDSNKLDKGFCIHTLYTLKKLLKKELTRVE